MRVLVVYAHYNPDSFTHAILEELTAGLEEAGHDCTLNDLQASGFDPVFKLDDSVQFIHPTVPEELLSETDLRDVVLGAAGDPLRRWMAKRWLRDKGRAGLIEEIGKRKPKDVIEQQRPGRRRGGTRLRRAGLLDGTAGDHQGLDRAGLHLRFRLHAHPRGMERGPQRPRPLLTQEKGLILTPDLLHRGGVRPRLARGDGHGALRLEPEDGRREGGSPRLLSRRGIGHRREAAG